MILINVSLILMAVPTDRVFITIVTQPHLNPRVGWGGGGWGTPYESLVRHFHIPLNTPNLHPKILRKHCFQFLCKILGGK